MKHTLIILILNLLLGSAAMGQELTANEIKGHWLVVGIHEFIEGPDDSDQQNVLKEMKAAFLEAEYIFMDNNLFSLVMDYKQFGLENVYWGYDEVNKKVRIREWKKGKQKPGKSITNLRLEKDGDLVLLSWGTTGIVLEVEKKLQALK